jgi:hypothetical protein
MVVPVTVTKVVLAIANHTLFHGHDHKCCIYATNLGHKCFIALVAFCFLGYNIGLNGEIMIKPGTLCMIRGVPQGRHGSEFNGYIVTANGFKTPQERIYWIEPKLVSNGIRFTGCREDWLYPFEDFGPEILTTTNKELETQ